MDSCIDDSVIYTPSTSWKYRNKNPTGYNKARVSNSTVGWIRKQSLLERFFYVIVLFVLLCLFILIYFSFTHVNVADPTEAALIHDQNITNECGKKCNISAYLNHGLNEIIARNISSKKSTIKPSLCSLVGLNHLISSNFLFNNTRDYYWFRPRPKLTENKINRNINIDLKDTLSFQDLKKNWSMECAVKKGSFWCKIKLFWESCTKHVNENSMNSYHGLLKKLELKDTLNNLDTQKLLDILEENGQSNGLYHYKPLFVYPYNEKIFIVGRDNYPHYSGESSPKSLIDHSKTFASKLNRLILSNNVTYQEMSEVLSLDDKLTKLKSLRDYYDEENERYQCGYYQLKETRNQFEIVNKPDSVIEYPNGYIKYLKKYLDKYNLKLYFLWTSYKTNLVHIDSTGLKYFTEFFGSSYDDISLTSTCRDMLKLPFGLVLLRKMIEVNSNGQLSDSKLSTIILNEILDSFDVSWLGGYKFDNGKLTQLIIKLKENIKYLIIKEKIQFDEYLTSVYEQLELTDNYFDNVQAIRKWLRKGYREGCILNLASI